MKVKLGDVCNIYSGGDKPEVVSAVPMEECNVPVYGNALEEEGLYGYTNFSVITEKAVTISARGSNCGASFYREEPYVPIVRLLSLIPKENIKLTEKDMLFFSTEEYRNFYKIARNYQTRSLNIDKTSVFFFGKLKEV